MKNLTFFFSQILSTSFTVFHTVKLVYKKEKLFSLLFLHVFNSRSEFVKEKETDFLKLYFKCLVNRQRKITEDEDTKNGVDKIMK